MRSPVCIIHDEGAVWEGVCPEFNLTVEGKTFEEVRRRLFDVVPEVALAAEGAKTRGLRRLVDGTDRLTRRLARLRGLIAYRLRDRDRGARLIYCPV